MSKDHHYLKRQPRLCLAVTVRAATGWYADDVGSIPRAGSLWLFQKLRFVDTALCLNLSLAVNETLKRLSSLPILMQTHPILMQNHILMQNYSGGDSAAGLRVR